MTRTPDTAPIDDINIPNATTRAALDAAERGEVEKIDSVDDLNTALRAAEERAEVLQSELTEFLDIGYSLERIANLSEKWSDSLVRQINEIARDALDRRSTDYADALRAAEAENAELTAFRNGYKDTIRRLQDSVSAAEAETARLREGWLPIVLCPTDGVERMTLLSDGSEVVARFDAGLLRSNRWEVITVAYHNPSRIVGQRGGMDQWSEAYDTYLVSPLPDGVVATHFRPNDTVHGRPKPVPQTEDDDGPITERRALGGSNET